MPSVSWLWVAPVKGLALVSVDEVALGPSGVAENRRFYVVDEDGERYGALRDGRLMAIEPTYESDGERLTLRFPDGEVVGGEVTLDGEVVTDFYGRPVRGRLVRGLWNEALSSYAGRPLRLVRGDDPGVDRGRGAVSILSDASLAELSRRSGHEVDGRRFRMLIGVAGTRRHEEDEWLGRRVRVGEATVLLHEQVARCAITTKNPESGERDFDTLRAIKAYRGGRGGGKEIDFGVYGEVAEPGRVRVGDAVEPL